MKRLLINILLKLLDAIEWIVYLISTHSFKKLLLKNKKYREQRYKPVPCFIFIENANTNRHFMLQEPEMKYSYRLNFFNLNLNSVWAKHIIMRSLGGQYKFTKDESIKENVFIIVGSSPAAMALYEEFVQNFQQDSEKTTIIMFGSNYNEFAINLKNKFPLLLSTCRSSIIQKSDALDINISCTISNTSKSGLDQIFVERNEEDIESLNIITQAFVTEAKDIFLFCCMDSDDCNINFLYSLSSLKSLSSIIKIYVHQKSSDEIVCRMRNLNRFNNIQAFGMESMDKILFHDELMKIAKIVLHDVEGENYKSDSTNKNSDCSKEYIYKLHEMMDIISFWEGYSFRNSRSNDKGNYTMYRGELSHILFQYIKGKRLFVPDFFRQIDDVDKYEDMPQTQKGLLNRISLAVIEEIHK